MSEHGQIIMLLAILVPCDRRKGGPCLLVGACAQEIFFALWHVVRRRSGEHRLGRARFRRCDWSDMKGGVILIAAGGGLLGGGV